MNEEKGGFPERDRRLGELLADAAPLRPRSDEDWAELGARIVAAGELPLARRRHVGWQAPLTARARGLAAAAAVALLFLGGMVYVTPRPGAAFVQASAELMDLLGEDEVRSFFPGVDDPDRLLEAALAAQ